MNPEQPKQPTPEEIAEIEKGRTISDAELLKGGAEYAVDENTEKKLVVTENQREDAHIEMVHEKNDQDRGLNEIEQAQVEEAWRQIDSEGIKNGDYVIAEYYDSKDWARDETNKIIPINHKTISETPRVQFEHYLFDDVNDNSGLNPRNYIELNGWPVGLWTIKNIRRAPLVAPEV